MKFGLSSRHPDQLPHFPHCPETARNFKYGTYKWRLWITICQCRQTVTHTCYGVARVEPAGADADELFLILHGLRGGGGGGGGGGEQDRCGRGGQDENRTRDHHGKRLLSSRAVDAILSWFLKSSLNIFDFLFVTGRMSFPLQYYIPKQI